MSSLRNAVKRVTHKERSQPAGRSRLGLLEKHKDYILRARDYEKKKKRLKSLKLKAALRNPDEFYFAMHKEATSNGELVLKGYVYHTYSAYIYMCVYVCVCMCVCGCSGA